MWYVYRVLMTRNKDNAVRVVAKNVDAAIKCLRSIEGEDTPVIECEREYMMGANSPRDLKGEDVHYVAGIDDVQEEPQAEVVEEPAYVAEPISAACDQMEAGEL